MIKQLGMEVNAGIPGIENLGTQTFQPSTIEPQTRKKMPLKLSVTMSLLLSLLVICSCTRKESKDCEQCNDIRECPECPIGYLTQSQT